VFSSARLGLGPLAFRVVAYTAELEDIVAEMGINTQHVCG